MKKVIFAALAAVVFSSAIGAASAYEYNKTAKVKSAACSCEICTCDNCTCTGCDNNCTCDDSCCGSGSDCGSSCCSK